MIMPVPPPYRCREIAARALAKTSTVRRAYLTPETCRPSTVERVRRAARALGILEPLAAQPEAVQPRTPVRP